MVWVGALHESQVKLANAQYFVDLECGILYNLLRLRCHTIVCGAKAPVFAHAEADCRNQLRFTSYTRKHTYH